jgi:hypothetical protein
MKPNLSENRGEAEEESLVEHWSTQTVTIELLSTRKVHN